MSLKTLVAERIFMDVIGIIDFISRHNKGSDARGPYVLVVDKQSMKTISACCKMHELMDKGVTIVEDLTESREPLPGMEALYLIQPESIPQLIKDFSPWFTENQYKCAHVFFTGACPDDWFYSLIQSSASMYIKTLKEISVAFTPYESQVFTLNSPDTFRLYFYRNLKPTDDNNMTDNRQLSVRDKNLEKIAEQIATVCDTLWEYPQIRYRRAFEMNKSLAYKVWNKMNKYKAENPMMGEGAVKARSILLIVDRGADVTSPLLTELTLQAVVNDVLSIENDVYMYETQTRYDSVDKEVLLDENNDVWAGLRHKHIADGAQEVNKGLKKLTDRRKGMTTRNKSIKDLSKMVKTMPQHQKQQSRYTTLVHLIERLMRIYKYDDMDKLCQAEQDLVTGVDGDGERVTDPVTLVVSVLTENRFFNADKLRIIMLYILHQQGISKEVLEKQLQQGDLPVEEKPTIDNMEYLNVNVTNEGGRKISSWQPHRKNRVTEDTYKTSRWVPVIKDIAEDIIDDKLDTEHYPFLSQRQNIPPGPAHNAPDFHNAPQRYWGEWSGYWGKRRTRMNQTKPGPRLIIFMVGGVTYSEMRTAYEVTEEIRAKPGKEPWEVIIGSCVGHGSFPVVDYIVLQQAQNPFVV